MARNSNVKIYFYIFDLLYFEGYDITHLPLHARKSILRRYFEYTDPLRFTIHRNKEGEAFYEQACDKGWEGLIAKCADSSYEHKRSSNWLKFNCVKQQELVIAGYTDPRGNRTGFGALLLGYYSNGFLQYAGKVGTGFNEQLLKTLSRKLKACEQQDCPYEKLPDDTGDDVHWITPKLVAELGFTEWTRDGRLRHPRFLGLRRDKPARKVVREVPG